MNRQSCASLASSRVGSGAAAADHHLERLRPRTRPLPSPAPLSRSKRPCLHPKPPLSLWTAEDACQRGLCGINMVRASRRTRHEAQRATPDACAQLDPLERSRAPRSRARANSRARRRPAEPRATRPTARSSRVSSQHVDAKTAGSKVGSERASAGLKTCSNEAFARNRTKGVQREHRITAEGRRGTSSGRPSDARRPVEPSSPWHLDPSPRRAASPSHILAALTRPRVSLRIPRSSCRRILGWHGDGTFLGCPSTGGGGTIAAVVSSAACTS